MKFSSPLLIAAFPLLLASLAEAHTEAIRHKPHPVESHRPHEVQSHQPHAAASHPKPQKPPKHPTALHEKPHKAHKH
jgi:hypothetical protein